MSENDMSDNELEIRDCVACTFGWRDYDHYMLNSDAIGQRMQGMFEYIICRELEIIELTKGRV